MASKDMAVAGPSKLTKGQRKKKVFAESLGVDHLVQLSRQIAGDHADKLQQRVEKAKDKQAWEKERNRQKNGGGANGGGGGNVEKATTSKSVPSPLSKSSHRASLVAKQREKSKIRKEARKAAKKEVDKQHIMRDKANDDGRKRVSFA